MVFVRNPSGVSHAPEEDVSLDDAAVAATALLRRPGAARVSTFELPAMVNAHSHAFQRDLRGAAERPAPEAHAADDFWSWREAMYRLAGEHDPASMRLAAGRVYAEMAAAGYGAVGEFHYVHHRPDGTPYPDPNAMAIAVAEAALAAGLRIVLLPAAYHRAGWNRPPTPGQRRFCDPDVGSYLARVDALRGLGGRAAGGRRRRRRPQRPRGAGRVAGGDRAPTPTSHGLVRHVHAHEQPRELEECREEHGVSPIELLHRTGFLGPRTSLIHGIHVSEADVGRLAASDTIVVSCPTTEGSLGDGHFPALRLPRRRASGSRSAATRTSASTRSRRRASSRRSRGASAAPATRCSPRYGDLWGELAANGRASLGLRDAGSVRDRPRAPGPGRRRDRRPPARGRDLRVGRGRRYAPAAIREERLLGGVLGERERLAVGVGGLGVAAEPAAAGRPSPPAGSGSRRGGRRAPAPRPPSSAAAGPSTIDSATARLSATTGDGQTRSSSS